MEKGNPCVQLVQMQIGIATMEKHMEVLQNFKIQLYDAEISLLSMYLKKTKYYLKEIPSLIYSLSKCQSLSHARFFVTPPWTIACLAPLSMGFFRQECWSRLLFPSPADLPDPAIEPRSPALKAGSLLFEVPWKPQTWDNPSV